MEWYQVTKTIKGRKYLYWQKTYRAGSSVKTLNKYIGPGANTPRMPSLANVMANKSDEHKSLRKQYDAGQVSKTAYLESIARLPGSGTIGQWPTAPPSQYEQTMSEHTAAIEQSQPVPKVPEKSVPDDRPRRENYTREEWLQIHREQRERTKEYDAAMKIENAKIRKAKRQTRGIKASNPFIAKAVQTAPSKTAYVPFGLEKGRYFCRRCEKQMHAVDFEGLCDACGSGTYFVRK